MIKKFLTLFLAFVMAFSLGACRGETPNDGNGDTPPTLTETEKYTQGVSEQLASTKSITVNFTYTLTFSHQETSKYYENEVEKHNDKYSYSNYNYDKYTGEGSLIINCSKTDFRAKLVIQIVNEWNTLGYIDQNTNDIELNFINGKIYKHFVGLVYEDCTSEYQDLVSTFERLKDAVGDTESLQATVEKLLATFFSDSQPENAKQQGEIHFTADVNHLIDTINAMDIDNVTTKEFVDVILSIFSEKLTVDSAIDFIKKTAKMKVSEVLNVIDAYLFNQTGKNLQGNYQAIVTSPIFTPLAKELLPIFIGNEKALVVIAMLKGLDVKEFLMTYKDFTVQQLVSSLLGVKVTDPDVLESKLNEYLSTPLKDFEVEGFSPYEYVDVLKSLTKQLILKEGQISAQILYNDYKIDKVCLSTNTCLADIVENLVALENSHTKFYEEKQVKLDCSAEITLNQNFAQITLPENATIRTI